MELINIMENRINKVMVFAPHMDDEVIGCGGSILKHIGAGREVVVVFFTDGSNLISDKKIADMLKKNRKQEAEAVMSFLGITAYYLDIPDRKLSYNTDILNRVIEILQKVQPDVIYIPHQKEGDREHRLVSEIFNEAFWLASETYQLISKKQMRTAKYILEYEVWEPIHNPNYSEDIEAFIDIKCGAIRMYNSQKNFFDYAFAIRGLNQYRGAISHLHYAEAFLIKKGNVELFEK